MTTPPWTQEEVKELSRIYQDEIKIEDVKTDEQWHDFVYQETYLKDPETYSHKEHWDAAEEHVFTRLSLTEADRIEPLL